MSITDKRSSIAIQIRFNDLDMAGHVHNSVYLHWFELARLAFQQRFIPKDHDWHTVGLYLVRNEVDHRAPVRLNDRILAHAWCSAVGNKSFDLCYMVERNDEGRSVVVAEGRSVMVCYDHVKSRSMAIPTDWRRALEALQLERPPILVGRTD